MVAPLSTTTTGWTLGQRQHALQRPGQLAGTIVREEDDTHPRAGLPHVVNLQ
jgi:hypothetical protein